MSNILAEGENQSFNKEMERTLKTITDKWIPAEIKGKKVSMKQSFKDYSSPIESIKDHIRLKMTSKHYTGYSTAASTDQALSCLKAYATGSSYLSDVKKLITRYNRTTARV